MSEAVRLDRKPQIHLELDELGLHFRMETVIHGDAEDWKADDVATFFMDIWEAARQTATLHRQFGLRLRGSTPTVHVADMLDSAAEIELPSPPPEPPMPAQAVLRVEEPTVPPARVPLGRNGEPSRRAGMTIAQQKARNRREREEIMQFLGSKSDHEATAAQLKAQFGTLTDGVRKFRLDELRDLGLIEFRKVSTPGNVNFGFYRLTEAGQEQLRQGGSEVPRTHPLTAILPLTSGRTWLMLGGDATRERVQGIEATFQLKEMRWPTFDDEEPIERRLREIEREDVDLVLCNRWNRRYSRHYQHKARECGKPFVMLTRGINPAQIAEQLRQQFVERKGPALALAA